MDASQKCSEPPHFDIFLNTLDEPRLKKIIGTIVLSQIKTNWKEEDLKFDFLTGGISNKILCCSNARTGERVLIRIYGENTDLVIDRKAEKECMKLLSSHGYSAPIYCTFKNAMAYGYVPGVVLNVHTVKDKNIATLVAKRLAEIHSIKIPNPQTATPCVLDQIEKFLRSVPDSFENPLDQTKYETEFLSLSELRKEYEKLKCRIQALNCPLVFCHNDLLLGNIIYDADKSSHQGNRQPLYKISLKSCNVFSTNLDCVTFIDFEYGGINYQAYDIADHFTEYAGTENVDFSLYPDEQYQMWWLKTYLEFYHKVNNLAPVAVNDVRILYVQVNVLSLASHFLWAVWAVIQAKHSSIDFGYLQYGIDRLREYFKLKKSFWMLSFP